jgi:hypothetical protein
VAWFLPRYGIAPDEAPTSMNSDSDRPAASSNEATRSSAELRVLAAWYRDYAEAAGNLMIWDHRLSTAEDLERQASKLERQRIPF